MNNEEVRNKAEAFFKGEKKTADYDRWEQRMVFVGPFLQARILAKIESVIQFNYKNLGRVWSKYIQLQLISGKSGTVYIKR